MSVIGEESELVQRLQSRLKHFEDQLQKAAHHGLQLLDGQLEMENKLEDQRIEMTNAVEALEQDKYSLQREVGLKVRVLESLRSDYDTLTTQQNLRLLQQEEHLERSHAIVLNDAKNQIERLRADLEESQLSEKQLRHQLELQTEALSNTMEELKAVNGSAQETMSSEMIELQVEKMELEAAKGELERLLQEAQYKEQHLELANSTLQRQLQRVTDDKEERERDSVSCFNALEKAREANQDLQIQLDLLLQQAQDPNSKGNSLFAELEDKRSEMARQLISMKVQYQSLQKQHVFSKQQLHHMKVQIATLMQLQGSRADPAQLERLQSMLSEKNSEIQSLMIKLQQLEKVEMTLKSQPSYAAGTYESGDGTYYTDLLKLQLSSSVKNSERLGDELSLQRMKSLAESQRALELERKLFSAERFLKQSQSDNIKLQLRLEDLRHKYEPNELKKNCTPKRRREKLPFDIPSQVRVMEEPVLEIEFLQQKPVEPGVQDAKIRPNQSNSVQPPSLNPTPQPSKCVSISEEPPVIIPRSPSGHSQMKKVHMETENEGEVNRQEGKRKEPRFQEVIHVNSKNSMENQCAQQ
ncbi:protein Spindly [Aplochiton taeniatus]